MGVKKRFANILTPCARGEREVVEVLNREHLFRKGEKVIRGADD